MMQSFAIRQKSNRTTRTLGRLLVFAVIPFGALLVMRLAFAMSSGLGLFIYTITYFALPYALFPVAGNSPLDEGYLWLMTLVVSVLVASGVTALSLRRSMAAACAIYAGLIVPVSVIIHALVAVSGNPWGLLLIE